MPNDLSTSDTDRQEFLGSTGVLRLNIHGREVDFRYPDSVYMRNVVLLILQGQEYPILNLPGYAPATIVDIGANVGATALYFLNAYPGARIFCYEPSLENLRCLRENTAPFAANIQVFPYGLLDRDYEAPLYRGTSQTGQNSLVASTETSAVPTEVVRVVRASHEAAERGWQAISILKLDTEGCEVPILTELLACVPHFDILYCEYHSDEDRRRIEALVGDRFLLCWSKAAAAHLGTCVYLARDLLPRYPDIDARRKSILRGV